MKKKISLFLFFLLSAQTIIMAHVGIDQPKGGEKFVPGNVVDINYYVVIDHGSCVWDLYFTIDDGTTWETIITGLPKSQLNYEWTIPTDLENYSCRIQVVQNNDPGSDYKIVSNEFYINSLTNVNDVQPQEFVIYPAFPNPFNSSTNISFSLSEKAFVELTIFNIAGQKIKTLIKRQMPGGLHQINWNANNNSSGIYFYQIKTGYTIKTNKLVLLK